MKFGIWAFCENLLREFKFHWNTTKITGTSHEDPCIFMIISRCVLLRMRNVSAEVAERINTNILCSRKFSWNLCRLWDNVKEYQTCHRLRCMHVACWVTKAIDTHSEYVIGMLIAFPRQQWLRERAWMSRLYVQCLCCFDNLSVFFRAPYYIHESRV
jgi:hypothetical protein